MTKKKTKKESEKKEEKPKVNPELEGFNIKIDSFGEISTTYNIDKINEFLNRNVDDKKLRDRDDLSGPKGKKGAKEKEEEENRKKEEDEDEDNPFENE